MAPKKANKGKGKDKVGTPTSSSPPAKKGRTATTTSGSRAAPLAILPPERRGDIPLTTDHRVDRVTVAAPIEEDRAFSAEQFLSAEAKRDHRLRLRNKHKIIQERGMEVPEPDVANIRAKIEERGWERTCEKPGKSNEDIVREFYANVAYYKSEIEAWVRGKKVVYSPDKLNIILYANRAASREAFQRYMRDVKYAEVCAILSPKRKEMPTPHNQFYFQRKELTLEAKAWTYFVSANLMPTNSVNTVHSSRALLAAAIIEGIEINVGDISYQKIRRCIKDLSLAPFFPSAITELCTIFYVPKIDGDQKSWPRDSITKVGSFKREKTPDKKESNVAAKKKGKQKATEGTRSREWCTSVAGSKPWRTG